MGKKCRAWKNRLCAALLLGTLGIGCAASFAAGDGHAAAESDLQMLAKQRGEEVRYPAPKTKYPGTYAKPPLPGRAEDMPS